MIYQEAPQQGRRDCAEVGSYLSYEGLPFSHSRRAILIGRQGMEESFSKPACEVDSELLDESVLPVEPAVGSRLLPISSTSSYSSIYEAVKQSDAEKQLFVCTSSSKLQPEVEAERALIQATPKGKGNPLSKAKNSINFPPPTTTKPEQALKITLRVTIHKNHDPLGCGAARHLPITSPFSPFTHQLTVNCHRPFQERQTRPLWCGKPRSSVILQAHESRLVSMWLLDTSISHRPRILIFLVPDSMHRHVDITPITSNVVLERSLR